ncbi:MAG: type II toxin-antitoxin system YoeB family toxin [Alphaproteobacteria bacterium]|nr:type II toxin-antitoxin system YoeB family toxin [Alphaproteobacteria bacterium]
MKTDKDKLSNKKFKSLLNKKISREDFSSLLRSDEGRKSKVCRIKWTSRARDQFSKIIAVNVKRILFLIEAIKSGDTKRGKPETLAQGIESRRINQKDRLVYRREGKEIEILSCEGHYDLVIDTASSTTRSAPSSSS